MKKISVILVAALLFCTQISFAQTVQSRAQTLTKTATPKQAAKDFGLSIIKSYFSHDCDFVFDRLHSTVVSIEGGNSIAVTPQMRTAFCADSPLRTDITVSYQMYKESYTQEVLGVKEVKMKYPQWFNSLNMQNGDYLFLGSQMKTAGATRLFVASDVARFLVRNINGKLKIVAM